MNNVLVINQAVFLVEVVVSSNNAIGIAVRRPATVVAVSVVANDGDRDEWKKIP